MILYIDSYFFMNFLFDIIIFLLAGRLMGARIILKRIVFSSFLGALFACFALFIPFSESMLFKLPVMAILSFAAFSYGNAAIFLRQTAILYIGFFISAGAAEALIFCDAVKNPAVMFSGLLLGFVTVFFVSGKIKERKYCSFAEIEILKDGKKYHLTALLDTGNTCRDFISGLPVLISENVFSGIKTREGKFSTASGDGVMKVFCPDEIRVFADGVMYEGRDVAVGVIEGRISSDGKFNALIGGNCFERLSGKN